MTTRSLCRLAFKFKISAGAITALRRATTRIAPTRHRTGGLELLVLLASLGLAGCTNMAPLYTRPEAPVPAAWPGGPAYQEGKALTGKAATDIPWQEFFLDPQLQKLITLALENNRDLRVAVLNIERSRAQYRISRAELLPQVDAIAAGSSQRLPETLSSSGQAETINHQSKTKKWGSSRPGSLEKMKRLQMNFPLRLAACLPVGTAAPLRTVLTQLAHTAPHRYLYFETNRFTIIDGRGMGNLAKSLRNFSQLMYPLFPRRLSHLKSSSLTS